MVGGGKVVLGGNDEEAEGAVVVGGMTDGLPEGADAAARTQVRDCLCQSTD